MVLKLENINPEQSKPSVSLPPLQYLVAILFEAVKITFSALDKPSTEIGLISFETTISSFFRKVWMVNRVPTAKSFLICGFNFSNSEMLILYFLESPYLVSLGKTVWKTS